MPSRRLPVNALRAFEAAARLGSMTAAAGELGVTHGAISRHVQSLEALFGIPLLRRLPKSVASTVEGGRLASCLTDGFSRIAAGVAALQPGPLTLSCSATIMMHWLIPRLGTFKAANPEIDLRLNVNYGEVDFIRDEISVAIRNDMIRPPQEVFLHKLVPEEIGPVCSPDFAGRHDLGDVSALLGLRLLLTRTRLSSWDDWRHAIGRQDLPLEAAEKFEHFYLLIQAAAFGLGVALAPRILVQDEISAGRLVAPFGFVPGPYHLVLWIAPHLRTRPDVKALVAWLCHEMVKRPLAGGLTRVVRAPISTDHALGLPPGGVIRSSPSEISTMSKLPQTSRAAVLRRFREPLKIECVPVPDRLEPRSLLVETLACSICGTDVHLSQGSLALKVDLPVIIGHEMVGRIIAMGEESARDSVGQNLKIGDRVLWTHTACGSCFYCTVARQPTLCDNRRAYMYETMERYPYLLGGFSEYGYVLPDSGRIKVPDTVGDDLASLCSCAFRSVMNGFNNLGAIEATDHVVIQGVGPLGLLATSVARMAGARSVIAIGAPDSRLELAREFGASLTLSIEATGVQERLEATRRATDGRGADIVMEFTGHPGAFNEGLDIVRKGGRYLVVGQLGDGDTTLKPSTIVKKNIAVIGSFSGDARSYWQALEFASRHQDQVPFTKMLTGRFPLAEVNIALDRMRQLQEIKPVIQFS